MDIRLAFRKGMTKKNDTAALPDSEDSWRNGEADPNMDDSQELLLKAQKDAEIAKAVARQAINRAFQQSEASVKRAELLAKAFDDALQGSFSQIHHDEENADTGLPDYKAVKARRIKTLLNNNQNPLNAISDKTRAFFTNKTVDAETRMDFYNLVIRQSKQLRELVDDLVKQQVQKKIEKVIEEAKSDRIASKLAVQQAQNELKKVREEAEEAIKTAEAKTEKAQSEAGASRKDAEEAVSIAKGWVEQAKSDITTEKKAADVKVSEAQQQAMGQAAIEIKKAKDEVTAAREAARIAIKQAEAEARRSLKEAEEIQRQAQIDVALAQDKARQETEKVETIKEQSQMAIDKALAEATGAKEEAKAARRESQKAVIRAQTESRKAIEETELIKRRLQETVIQAQEQTYQDICEEMNRVKEEAEATRKQACESITRAQEESRKAREEAESVKQAAEESLSRALEEGQQAREEAEKAKKTLAEVTARAQEEIHRAKEESEAAILKANETIKNARQDIIGMTIGEITKTRQELEAASQNPGSMRDNPPKTEKPTADAIEPAGEVDGDYIAAVLHEMRAPLHSISGFASLMLEDGVSDAKTQKEFLSIVVQQSESLNRLLDDLSGLLKPGDRETFNIDKETVSPHKLITETVQSAEGTALQKKNVIILSIPGDLPAIEADAMRLKQVLLNLITNAVKFSPDNTTVIVRAEVKDSELLIQVKDHGIGIPQDEIPAIFDEHYRASNHGDAEGTGLGLYICRQIVEAHGGRIRAESAEGQGSTFSITFPLAPVSLR
jgi:signal transduction histidine kinase